MKLYLGDTLLNEDFVIANQMCLRNEFDLNLVDNRYWQVNFVTKYRFNELDPKLTLIIMQGDKIVVTATNLRVAYG